MARTMWALRIEGKTSKACWAPGSSAYTTERLEVPRSFSTNSRAWSTATRVSRAPCRTKKSGASSVIRRIGEAASKASGSSVQRLWRIRGREELVAHLLGAAQPGGAGEVVDAVVGDRHLHAGVGVLEAGLEGAVARR